MIDNRLIGRTDRRFAAVLFAVVAVFCSIADADAPAVLAADQTTAVAAAIDLELCRRRSGSSINATTDRSRSATTD